MLLILLTPLTCILSIEMNVVTSTRVTDVRSASQPGGVIFAPFIGIYIAGEIGVVTLDTAPLLIISAVFTLRAAGVFFLSTRTFQREEILTKWK